jgi:hypothetical protein
MTGYTDDVTARLLDRVAIDAVLTRYARGVDRIDIPLIKSAFWPGAIDEHGTFNGPADKFADYLNQSLRAFEVSSHVLSNLHVEFDGDKANVESYFTATHVMTPLAGGVRFVLAGRYLDQMEKRGGEWRIMHRRLVRDWADIPEGADHVRALLDKIERRGRAAPDDPWYVEIVGTGA